MFCMRGLQRVMGCERVAFRQANFYLEKLIPPAFSTRKGSELEGRSSLRFRKLKENAMRVTIVGSAGSIGSKLALLLKSSSDIDALHLYDPAGDNYGMSLDLSHIDSKSKIFSFGEDQLHDALFGCRVVVICASATWRPGMTTEQMFEANAEKVEEIATACTEVCPQAVVLVVSQPVDCLTPLVGQVFDNAKLNGRAQVIGNTSSNVMRASSVLAETLGCDSTDIVVPVIGGHTSDTIVPLFSCTIPKTTDFKSEEYRLCEKMMAPYKTHQPDDSVKRTLENMAYLVRHWQVWVPGTAPAKHSATITGAVSAARTTVHIIQGLENRLSTDSGFVQTDVIPGLTYCTVPLKFGRGGVEESYPLPPITEMEGSMLDNAIAYLQPSIHMGQRFAVKKYINRLMAKHSIKDDEQ